MSNGIDYNELQSILKNNDKLIDLNDLTFKKYLDDAKKMPKMKKLFGNYIHTNELCVLAGKTGRGKSILAYLLADSICNGNDLLGNDNECEPQPVLYFDFELLHGNIMKRFVDYEPPPTFYRPDMTKLLLKNDGKFTIENIKQYTILTGAKFLVIDNISAIGLRSLQDQDAALNLMKGLTLLKSELNVTILAVSHTPKLQHDKPLSVYDIAGSGHIMNFIDSALMINDSCQDVNLRYLKQVKSRNSEGYDDVMLLNVIHDGKLLQLEYEGYDNELAHLEVDDNKERAKINKLKAVAIEIIGKSNKTYSDFCNEYAKVYNKTYENGKKIHSQLKRNNIIIKDTETGKWFINGNELQY